MVVSSGERWQNLTYVVLVVGSGRSSRGVGGGKGSGSSASDGTECFLNITQ